MTRDECKAAVLSSLGETLRISSGLQVDAEWAPGLVDELLDLYYPNPEQVFGESDVAALSLHLRIRWEEGRAG